MQKIGLPYEILERNAGIGGVWDIDAPRSPMYASAQLVSSKTVSGFPEFPMPDAYADYPKHPDVLAYLRDFADRFDIARHVRTNADVIRVERRESPNGWLVTLHTGEVRSYRALILATGLQWHPRPHTIPGSFRGDLFHSSEYKTPDRLRGKRVLVIGSGNSGIDIACDASRAAVATSLSMRRGNWIVPKYLFGAPSDRSARGGSRLPLRLRQLITELLLGFAVGNLERWGFPRPAHRVYELPPILNSAIIDAVRRGTIRIRADVRSFEGSEVTFADGSADTFDTVILATGFTVDFTYVDGPYLDLDRGMPDLFLHVFPRSIDDLALLGLPGAEAGGLPAVALQADLAAHVFARTIADPQSLAAFQRLKLTRPDLSGGIRFVDAPRNRLAVSARRYCEVLGALLDRFERGTI